jgi:hypothetical protein
MFCKIIGNINKNSLNTILDIMATLAANFTIGFLWPWYRRSMLRDKPIIVFISQPVGVLFSTTNIHTSASNIRIVLLAKVVDAELGITFFHNLDIWIRMDRCCVATTFANLDVEHQKR